MNFNFTVTPHAGVWIETLGVIPDCEEAQSHLTQVCGLKPDTLYSPPEGICVTPHAGVWIETANSKRGWQKLHSHTSRRCVD